MAEASWRNDPSSWSGYCVRVRRAQSGAIVRQAGKGMCMTAARGILVLVLAVTLAACGTDDPDTYVERPVEEIYNNAVNLLEAGERSLAVAEFEEVERQHPYSQWAKHAQVMSAYASYLQGDFDTAIASASRFIDSHPGNENAVYAYYLIAQSYYERISDVERDQRMAERSRDAFLELLRLFPDSPYSRDATLKLELTLDHLAGKEMSIGRWYQERGAYIAAVNRFRTVIDQYQTTSHVPEALLRLVETYLALGLVGQARDSAAVLAHNYPGSDWYEDAWSLLAQHRLLS